MVSQARLRALLLLIRAGRVGVSDIKDEEYRQAVEEALRNDES